MDNFMDDSNLIRHQSALLERDRLHSRQGMVRHLTLLGLIGLAALPSVIFSEDFADPAPPQVATVPTDAPDLVAQPFDRLTFHVAPKALSPDAVVADWPRYLGPADNCTTSERPLLGSLPDAGPTLVWEIEKGGGYTSAIIAEGRLVLFDRYDEEEVVSAHDPETGQRFWEDRFPVEYQDRYGFNPGPRASAVIAQGKVYTLGVTSTLTCHDLRSGTRLWQRRLDQEFSRASYFFGHGCTPLVYEGKVIVPLGTDDKMSVAAFDADSGALLWGTRHEWNASYGSPIVAELQGAPRLLVLGGGESKPATGGLLCIDPKTGALHDAFPWRAEKYESVNGQTPVAVGNDQVYISDAYELGGVLLRLTPELKWEEVWKAPDFGMHWTVPLIVDGQLYGFRGRNEPDAWFASYDIATGKENWRADPEWSVPLESGREYRLRYFRGSLLHNPERSYALSELGTLGIFDLKPEEFVEVGRCQLFVAQATWSPPVVSHGLLYISQHEPAMGGEAPRVLCYDFRGE